MMERKLESEAENRILYLGMYLEAYYVRRRISMGKLLVLPQSLGYLNDFSFGTLC